jgi:ABC-type sugar transport system ATPase subunit
MLSVRNLKLDRGSAPFTFDVDAGHILGLSGLERGGQEEFLQALCGLRRTFSGEITVNGKNFGTRGVKNLHDAFDSGIVYVPRERKTEGILASQSVLANFAIATLERYSIFGFVLQRRERDAYETFAGELGVVCESTRTPIRNLSGGNQQKVLLARWLAASPRILLLNDPSRGIDHLTKQAMHDVYRRIASAGTIVILLSSEIEELLDVADSTVVFRERSVQEILPHDRMTRSNILKAMFATKVA